MTRSIICWTSVILFLVIMGNPIFARDNVRLRSPDEARQDSILDLIGEEFDESMLDELMGMEEGPSGAIEDYTIGYTKTEGMFTYYTDETTRQVLIALDTEQLDHTYFLSLTLSGGTGDFMFTAPMMWGQMPFLFHRDGESVEFVEPNYAITTVMGEPMAGAVEAGVSDTILGRAYIEAEDVDDGRVLIDLSTFLLTVSGLDAMGLYTGLMIMVDYEGSYVEEIKGFPLNDEIDARVLVYGAGDATGYSPMGAQELGLHYSLSEPPEPGFVPRLADDRLGFFLDMSMNYSVATDREDTRMVRYVNRWRLEKQDPDAELSPPIEPIVFWLENTIPYEYRDAVEEGILAWNKAYERIGFENAIEVYQMPDDADWDPADIRYNTIRWFVSPSSNYAIGPSITDPRTGEIYAADIGVNADMMRSIHLEYELTVGPIQEGALELLLPPGWPNLGHRQVPWDEETLDILERQMDFVQRNGSHCLYSAMMQFEAARGLEILCGCCAGEEPNTEAEERFVHDYLVGLICHEVGHTLGMAHNFAGSAATPYENLNDIYWTQQHGLSSSIMDYTTSNIAPIGTDQGEYFQSVPGDYDNWVIEYAYTQTNAELPEDEIGIMSEIASRSPQYRYGSQIETFGWTRNMDPDLETWDLSDNIQNTYRDSFEQSEFLLDGILERYSEPGTRPVKIRRAFIYALWPYFRAALAVPRKIGGIRAYYDHIGDPDARPR